MVITQCHITLVHNYANYQQCLVFQLHMLGEAQIKVDGNI